MDQFKALELGLRGIGVGHAASFHARSQQPLKTGPALPCYSGEEQGLHSRVLQQVWDVVSSPTLMTQVPAFPPIIDGEDEGGEEGMSLLSIPLPSRQKTGLAFLCSHPWGRLTCHPHIQS